MNPKKIKVFIVDDSALVREVVSKAIGRVHDMRVVGVASDPLFAGEKMRQDWPDVILLDLEMPRMDGLSFLRKLMRERPTPVIVCSSLTEKGNDTWLQALSAGAVSVITKPKSGLKGFLEDSSNDLIATIRAAGQANLRVLAHSVVAVPERPPLTGSSPPLTADAMLAPGRQSLTKTTDQVIAIGTSTGGTQAIEAVLTRLPVTVAGIVIVQHMPERFTALFAERLNSLCALDVREAKSNDRVVTGRVLIAPGGKHMMLRRNGAQYHVDVVDGPVVNRHKPSVDVLFRSVAKFAGRNALGVIMTGMGDDGARGMKEMKDAGASTIAQDEASCVVFGMPKEAIKHGGVDRVLSLEQIPQALIDASRG
ncbi:MAG: chemotaxis response regulator protein-glutamate methylesterase [Candidatus Accumulibacter sp.]|nr:chemotaxis response regulator protein-glutamate methylesterase [Accumulibacter sp.]